MKDLVPDVCFIAMVIGWALLCAALIGGCGHGQRPCVYGAIGRTGDQSGKCMERGR